MIITKKSCKVEGCTGNGKLHTKTGARYFELGYCVAHYKRFKRYGNPLMQAKQSPNHPDAIPELSNIYHNIKGRCLNTNDHAYDEYGGRGITLCDSWQGVDGFVNFCKDMGKRPTPQHSIDRIDNSKGYSKENCRWATRTEQANNRRSNRTLTAFGVTKNINEWSREFGVKQPTIFIRLKEGRMTPEEAVSLPPMGYPRPRKTIDK